MMGLRGTAVLALLAVALPSRAAAPERFAIVIGNNVAPDADLVALRYADDDAARLHEFLLSAGYHSTLLTVPDEETQALMPGMVPQAAPPTRERVLHALADTEVQVARSRAAGRTAELVFAFAGHGAGAADKGASIYLLDGPFTRQDLADHVVRASTADFIHIVVDACDSYFMVAARGEKYADDRVDASRTESLIRQYLGGDGPMQDPRTGFLVSTNQAAQSHEYEGFRSGVFSHVVHSALAGAADANRDGRVEYSEVLAYAAAASQEIRDPRARLAVYGRPPPRDVHRPLMDLADSRFSHYLRLGPELHGRLHVEDGRSVRYADINKPAGSEILLALADTSTSYRVVRETGEGARVDLRHDRRGAVRVGEFTAATTLSRGVLSAELRKELFSIPYDASFYRGYVASRQLAPAASRGTFNPPEAGRRAFFPSRPRLLFGIPGLGMLGAGGLLGAGAGLSLVLTKFAYDAYGRSLRSEGVTDKAAETRINVLRISTGVLLGAGMLALALGGILIGVELLWPVAREETP